VEQLEERVRAQAEQLAAAAEQARALSAARQSLLRETEQLSKQLEAAQRGAAGGSTQRLRARAGDEPDAVAVDVDDVEANDGAAFPGGRADGFRALR
jgi:hypothetical protein